MYEWNQHRTTPDNPLLQHSSAGGCVERRGGSSRRRSKNLFVALINCLHVN